MPMVLCHKVDAAEGASNFPVHAGADGEILYRHRFIDCRTPVGRA